VKPVYTGFVSEKSAKMPLQPAPALTIRNLKYPPLETRAYSGVWDKKSKTRASAAMPVRTGF